MNPRFVDSENDRKALLLFIGSRELPLTVTITAGGKRGSQQNRLAFQWYREIGDQCFGRDTEEARAHCKLHHGVPIRKNDDPDYAALYDEAIRPLPYELKMKLMRAPTDFPVTRDMSVKQMTRYLDAIWAEFAAQGVMLTDPSMLGLDTIRLASAA